jgi:hypothetical protein
MCLKLLMLGEITEIVNGSIRSVNSPEQLSGAVGQPHDKSCSRNSGLGSIA